MFSITPVVRLKLDQLKELIQEAIRVIREKCGGPIAVICGNCPLNQGVYCLFCSPSRIL